jgi:hypothetical protein
VYLFMSIPVATRIEIVGTTLLAAMGAWLWTGKVTKSAALKAFVAVVFAINGRWAFQAATGHAWHMYYCWMPWAFYFFENACENFESPKGLRRRDLLLAGGAFALMIYNCGIYPLPHTATLLGLYGLVRSLFRRRLYPVVLSVSCIVSGVILSAPKLFPIVENMRRFPRIVESNESIDLFGFVQLLTATDQSMGAPAAHVSQWGWHEYGMYIGWVPVLILLIGLIDTKSETERTLSWVGVVAVVLGFGAFHPYSPWTLLHQLPSFSSQHVPSRWLYPGALLLSVMAAAVIERRLLSLRPNVRNWVEWLLLVPVAFVAFNIAGQSAHIMKSAYWRKYSPQVTPGEFYQIEQPSAKLRYEGGEYAPEVIPAMKANVGVITCTLHAGQNAWAEKNARGRIVGVGAYGRDEPRYRGETYLVGSDGTASIAKWSPNEVVVNVQGATPGTLLVLNQNWAPGWRADGHPAISHEDAVATPLTSGTTTVVFRFRSPTTWLGLLTLLAFAVALRFGWSYLPGKCRANRLAQA